MSLTQPPFADRERGVANLVREVRFRVPETLRPPSYEDGNAVAPDTAVEHIWHVTAVEVRRALDWTGYRVSAMVERGSTGVLLRLDNVLITHWDLHKEPYRGIADKLSAAARRELDKLPMDARP